MAIVVLNDYCAQWFMANKLYDMHVRIAPAGEGMICIKIIKTKSNTSFEFGFGGNSTLQDLEAYLSVGVAAINRKN